MDQIFILGASSAYGVGGKNGGYGELIKQHMHSLMYSKNGAGEKCEVYNFSKPGGTIEFVKSTFPEQLKQYGRDGEILVIVSVGGNNAKAKNEPENYVSTPEEFSEEINALLILLKDECSKVIVVSNWYVDEDKTNPKHNPFTGGKSYFTNERRELFNKITKQFCEQLGLTYITPGVDKDEWVERYIYTDGLHPNQAGYDLIFEKIKDNLPKIS